MSLIPKFGTFTNGVYDIKGVVIFKRVIGKVVRTDYPYIHGMGKWVYLSEYHLKGDTKPQFIRKSKYNMWYSNDEIEWFKY